MDIKPEELLKKIRDLEGTQQKSIFKEKEFWGIKNAGVLGIQEAINSLPTDGGMAFLPAGDYRITSKAIIRNNCTLCGQGNPNIITENKGTRIHIVGDIDGIQINPGGRLWNVMVYTDVGYTKKAIIVGKKEDYIRGVQKVLDNIIIRGADTDDGYGLFIQGYASTSNAAVYLCTFGPITVRNFAQGIYLRADESGGMSGYVNANFFEQLLLDHNKYPLTLYAPGTASVSGNHFSSIQIQPLDSVTVDGIRLTGNCQYNIISAGTTWDWGGASGTALALASDTYRNTCIGDYTSVTDTGSENLVINSRNPINAISWHWLATSVTKTGGTDYTTDGAWEDLDLTSATSANAKFVILVLRHKNTCTAGDVFRVRKNGDTPANTVAIWAQVTSQYNEAQVIVACDSGQVIEVYATDASDTNIYVLGYLE